MRSVLIAFLASVACASGCASDSDDRFRCGRGPCALGSEICVVVGTDACGTCIDDGVCSEIEGGSVVTCAEATWGCG